MKRKFEIEWPDDCGPMWMNTSNLLLCLTNYCRNTRFTVRDVTGDGNPYAESAGPANPAADERDLQQITEAVARGWCHPANETKVMDPNLATAIADEVFKATR